MGKVIISINDIDRYWRPKKLKKKEKRKKEGE